MTFEETAEYTALMAKNLFFGNLTEEEFTRMYYLSTKVVDTDTKDDTMRYD